MERARTIVCHRSLILIVFIAATSFAQPGSQPDVNATQRMADATVLARAGKHEEALKEYLWCFDHGHLHDKGFGGLRTSTLIAQIAELGQEYPPAMDALVERFDNAKSAVLSEGDRERLQELMILGRYLQREDELLEVFDDVKWSHDEDSQTLRGLSIFLSNKLYELGRFDDFLIGVGDVRQWVSAKRRARDIGIEQAHSVDIPEEDRDELITVFQTMLLDDASRVHEALLATGRVEEAELLRQLLLEFDSSAEMFTALAEGARRAGAEKLASQLADRAATQPDR